MSESETPDYAVGPPPGHVDPPGTWYPPATRDQREVGMAKARVGLAAIGTPCACGCGPLVHRHTSQADHHCGFCGAEACRTYRAVASTQTVTRIPDLPRHDANSEVA